MTTTKKQLTQELVSLVGKYEHQYNYSFDVASPLNISIETNTQPALYGSLTFHSDDLLYLNDGASTYAVLTNDGFGMPVSYKKHKDELEAYAKENGITLEWKKYSFSFDVEGFAPAEFADVWESYDRVLRYAYEVLKDEPFLPAEI